MKFIKRIGVLLVLAPSAFAALTMSLHFARAPIDFHQFEMHKLDFKYGGLNWESALDCMTASSSSGWSILRGNGEDQAKLSDKQGMFDFVFSWLPGRAVVYPTEGFYYFSATIEGEEIRGNLRLADALSKGTVSFAYFKIDSKETWILEVGKADGLEVREVSEDSIELKWRGKAVVFRMPVSSGQVHLVEGLLDGERWIGEIVDESGVRLNLVFNEKTNSYYEYLLSTEKYPGELIPIGDSLQICNRTGFIYFTDLGTGRYILVGVPLRNVILNDYFDGPGDQVPFDAFLRDSLYLAYPQTLLGEGIDDFGVYKGMDEWMRIAICPYHRYSEIGEIRKRVAAAPAGLEGGQLFTFLTKEWWNTDFWRNGVSKKLEGEGKWDPILNCPRVDIVEQAKLDRIRNNEL